MTPSNRGSQPKSGAGRPRQSSSKASAEVYRRRRITVLVVILVLLGLLGLGVYQVVRLTSGGEEPTAETTPSPEPTEIAPVPDKSAASGVCPEEKVAVSAKADKESYNENTKPKFKLVITNENQVTCLIEVGTKEQEFLVKRDGDVVWSSKFCAVEDDENAQQSTAFAPQSEKVAQFQWNRIPVDKNCNKTGETFPAGDYELVVKLGDKTSEPVPFVLEKDAATKAKEKAEKEDAEKTEEPVETGAPDEDGSESGE